jgi:ribosomal protein S18 acetylase RimI-like enzyme
MILSFKLFETASSIEGYYFSEDDDYDEESPLDRSEMIQRAYDLAKNCGVNILSDKNLLYIFYDNKFEKIVGALFTSVSDTYSFDIVVDRSYENVGMGTKLVKIAISHFEEYKDANPDLTMEIDCINPVMANILRKKFGFEDGPILGPDRIIMTKTFD